MPGSCPRVPLVGVKRISEYLVEPEVSDQRETVVGRHSRRVGVRLLLPFLVYAEPWCCTKAEASPSRPSFRHRENGHAAQSIVRYQGVFAGLVERDVGRAADRATTPGSKRQLAAGRIDGEGSSPLRSAGPVTFNLIDCVQEMSARIDGQERRLRGFGGQSQCG